MKKKKQKQRIKFYYFVLIILLAFFGYKMYNYWPKIYSNNKETISKIVKILLDSGDIFKYLKDGEAAYYSMYDIEEVKQIEGVYASKNSVVVFQNFEGFTEKEDSFKNKFISKFDETLSKNENQVLTILCAKNKDLINEAFSKNDELLQKYFDFEITGIEPDVQDAYQDILNNLGLASGDVDTYINRIIFPLNNINGKINGFSGRIYHGENTNKYEFAAYFKVIIE